jgi:hypothetical protein
MPKVLIVPPFTKVRHWILVMCSTSSPNFGIKLWWVEPLLANNYRVECVLQIFQKDLILENFK